MNHGWSQHRSSPAPRRRSVLRPISLDSLELRQLMATSAGGVSSAFLDGLMPRSAEMDLMPPFPPPPPPGSEWLVLGSAFEPQPKNGTFDSGDIKLGSQPIDLILSIPSDLSETSSSAKLRISLAASIPQSPDFAWPMQVCILGSNTPIGTLAVGAEAVLLEVELTPSDLQDRDSLQLRIEPIPETKSTAPSGSSELRADQHDDARLLYTIELVSDSFGADVTTPGGPDSYSPPVDRPTTSPAGGSGFSAIPAPHWTVILPDTASNWMPGVTESLPRVAGPNWPSGGPNTASRVASPVQVAMPMRRAGLSLGFLGSDTPVEPELYAVDLPSHASESAPTSDSAFLAQADAQLQTAFEPLASAAPALLRPFEPALLDGPAEPDWEGMEDLVVAALDHLLVSPDALQPTGSSGLLELVAAADRPAESSLPLASVPLSDEPGLAVRPRVDAAVAIMGGLVMGMVPWLVGPRSKPHRQGMGVRRAARHLMSRAGRFGFGSRI